MDCIGFADSKKELKTIANKRYEDTDGECVIAYIEIDRTDDIYHVDNLKIIEIF